LFDQSYYRKPDFDDLVSNGMWIKSVNPILFTERMK